MPTGKRKSIAIVQSNYIPWKGYFDLINRVDEFVLYDDTQYTRRDWRNRNRIKTSNGLIWLTVPVQVKGNYFQAIKDTRINDPNWPEKHWSTLGHSYSKAEFFDTYRPILEPLYLECREKYLSKVNHRFLSAICDILDITTPITWSMDYPPAEGKSERLLAICEASGANHYLSGPAAKDYLDEELFRQAGVEVEWMDYSGYPEYSQLHGPFEHGVTVMDVIFNEGPNATRFMKSFPGQDNPLDL